MTKQEIGAVLMKLRKEAGKSREEVAQSLGKSVKTVGHWETGHAQPDTNTLFLLCAMYGADLHTSFGLPESKKAPSLSDEAQKIAEDYDSLDAPGKSLVKVVIAEERKRFQAERERRLEKEVWMDHGDEYGEHADPRVIPLYYTPAAAGYASPVFEEDFEYVEVGGTVPRQADFAVRISGDSMEPYIMDGATVYVNRDPMENGDVGIFYLDGDMLCKQYYKDENGHVRLLSLNRNRADADRFVHAGDDAVLSCFGRVILEHRPKLNIP